MTETNTSAAERITAMSNALDAELDALREELHDAKTKVDRLSWEIDGIEERHLEVVEQLRKLVLASPPGTLADIPKWLASIPRQRPVWWGRCGDGLSAFATDGHGLVVVDNVPDATASARWTPSAAAETIARVEKGVAPNRESFVVKAQWLALENDVQRVRVFGAWLDAELVRLWVTPVALAAGGLVVVEASPEAELDAVRFVGEGWRLLLMPMRCDDDDWSGMVVVDLHGRTMEVP